RLKRFSSSPLSVDASGSKFPLETSPCISSTHDTVNRKRSLVPRCKRQQGDVPCLLDCAGQASLVRGANAREPARHYLAALGHKPLQQTNIAVRDRVNFLRAELADLLAAEELAASARTTTGTTA